MDSLTVGYVSGLIAAAVAITQFIIPNALALMLVAALSDRHSAVTWSVVSRSLSNTHWPLLLGSDQTTSSGVARRVSLIVWLRPVMLLCTAIAAIVTPMGLYEVIASSKDLTPTSFFYIQDTGPFGLGTASRSGVGFSRKCGYNIPVVCPGSTGTVNLTKNRTSVTGHTDKLDFRLPEDLAKLYQSGLAHQKPTVSSFFDIESRLYNIAFNADQSNATYLQESYHPIGTFILDEKASLVEGLVVDPQNSRIGFRNHSAPSHTNHGAEWEEDLLFFEPETACVNLNLTLELEVGEYGLSKTSVLIDDGGFASMAIVNPWSSKIDKYPLYDGTQEDPQLFWRAKATAWGSNAFIAYFMNITKPGNREAYMNTTIGNRFVVGTTDLSSGTSKLNEVQMNSISQPIIPDITERYFRSNDSTNFTYTSQKIWENPFGISTANFTMLKDVCEGVGTKIWGEANITNILVKCGYILGISQPVDGEKTLIPRRNTRWRRPIYSCASSTRASIKTVRFRYNSSDYLPRVVDQIEVVHIIDKVYKNIDSMPLWGVENANMSVLDIAPLWGIIDPAQRDHINLSTVQADHLYIPAGRSSLLSHSGFDEYDYMPAVNGPARAWQRAYNPLFGSAGSHYTGGLNSAVYEQWDKLTRTSEGTAKMLNKIWMDHAANGMTGTRGQLSTTLLPPNLQGNPEQKQSRDEQRATAMVDVFLYHRVLRYKWAYGIPALVTGVLVALICLSALVAVLIGHTSPQRVKHYLWNLSAGRLLTWFIYPSSSTPYSDTKQWVQDVGAREITLADIPAKPGSSRSSVTTLGSGFTSYSTSYERVEQEEYLSAKHGAIGRTREL